MTLPLDFIVDVTVQVSPQAVQPPQFNQALIIGKSTVLPLSGPNSRVRLYSGGLVALQQMLTDGFSSTSAEYLAAQAYFSQIPTPFYLWIGVQGPTETPLQAAQACRVASPDWYLFTIQGAIDDDIVAVSQWVQTASPVAQYFWQTSSPDCLTGINDPFSILTRATLNRYIGTYITTQGGTALNNNYFAAGLMGLVMGRNTGLAGSYFILPFKNVIGMIVEPVTAGQFNTINGNNGNVYSSYANTYNSLSPGVTGSGQYFDQILGIDMLVSDLQYDMTNTLFLYPAIPQTDEGQSVLIQSANTSCSKSVNRGFLSPGVWQGQTILKLQAGMSIPGYLNQSPTYASLGAKPANRQAAPIYCAVILSEAVQSVLIAVYVQQ
jgi:hypothetical protein